MCELIYMQSIRNSVLTQRQLRELCVQFAEASLFNSDAWGAFNEKGETLKNAGFFTEKNYAEFCEFFKKSVWIVAHARLATGGNTKVSHPFVYDNFFLSHNGIVNSTLFQQTEKNEKVDSEEMLRLIVEKNEDDVTKGIQKAMKKISGFASVFLYDLTQKNLYYFVTEKSKFNFFYDRAQSLILGATKAERIKNMFVHNEYGFVLKRKLLHFELENESIYTLSVKGIQKIAAFEMKSGGGWDAFGYSSSLDEYGYKKKKGSYCYADYSEKKYDSRYMNY